MATPKSVVPKVTRPRPRRLELAWEGLFPPDRYQPHILYANLDFSGNYMRSGRWLLNSVGLPSWSDERTMQYLKEHQAEFRRCLEWLSEGSYVDFSTKGIKADDEELRELWAKEPEVRFLQEHGLDHAGVRFAPVLSDPIHPFFGLELEQGCAKDPLDPICWYVMTLLSTFGTVFVQRCGYHKCEKFFFAKTVRRQFCSDMCRALNHAGYAAGDLMSSDYQERREQFRARRAEYMKRYRANARRRLIEYRRAEEAAGKKRK